VKTVLGHIPRVASCTHNTPVQLRLPFHTPECGQGAAIPIPHYVVLQYTVQKGDHILQFVHSPPGKYWDIPGYARLTHERTSYHGISRANLWS